jgi:hypothetical protein
VVPILKPGKDSMNPTSCMCKLIEKMVNKRLSWYLESHEMIDTEQLGFRKIRSTKKCLILLETELETAFCNKEHVVAISFDLEKAYDTASRYNISKNLQQMTIKGRLLRFIANFMFNRSFRVLDGGTMSEK